MNNNNIRSSEKNMVSNIGISPTNQNYENFINNKSVEKNDLDINESSRGETKNEIDYYSQNYQNLKDKNMVIYREKKMMTKKYKNNISFIIHRNNGMNDYIIALNLQKINKSNITKPTFIMILDLSGSMAGHVRKFITKIIPEGLNKLCYSDYDIIHLITFNDKVNYRKIKIKELKNNKSLEGIGSTFMAGVYDKIKTIFENDKNNKDYRILALSDGKIFDQKKTIDKAEDLVKFIQNKNYTISVGSFRYNSGVDSPDTRAISSVLRLNNDNSKERVLTNISSFESNEIISQKMFEFFKDDFFQTDYVLKSEKIKFRLEPWNKGSNQVRLKEGENIIFTDEYPSSTEISSICEVNDKLKFTREDYRNGYNIKYENYNELLGVKFQMAIRKVRINKTLESKQALAENEKIINYLEKFEKNLVGNKHKKTWYTDELKKTNKLDISKFKDNELAKFIGVDSSLAIITKSLRNFIVGENYDKDDDNIDKFIKNMTRVIKKGIIIDLIHDQIFDY